MLPGLGRAASEGRLSLREAARLNRELLVAVTDSTVNHLASAILLLARHLALLDALHQDERLEPFIEGGVAPRIAFADFWRRCRHQTELTRIKMPTGSLVLRAYPALKPRFRRARTDRQG